MHSNFYFYREIVFFLSFLEGDETRGRVKAVDVRENVCRKKGRVILMVRENIRDMRGTVVILAITDA